MLLLTDRERDGQRLQRLLAEAGPCRIVPLSAHEPQRVAPPLIVCDVAFDTLGSSDGLRRALTRLAVPPDTPVLCLLRDPSHLTLAQARSAGATATLPAQADPGELIRTVRMLMSAQASDAAGASAPIDAAGSVASVASALGAIIGVDAQRQIIAPTTLTAAGGVLLAAIKQVSIQAWLDVVWAHDDPTYQHCLLVAGLSAAFAIELGMPPKAQHLLSQAALIHDIGKSRIPRQILNKATPLTPEESVVMRSHAALGHAMLVLQSGFDPTILDVVRHHHELLDGTGYPDGLAGQQVSRMVRMVTICDIYAALIERRSYKAPVTSRTATSYLASLGPKLDGALVSAFRNVVRET